MFALAFCHPVLHAVALATLLMDNFAVCEICDINEKPVILSLKDGFAYVTASFCASIRIAVPLSQRQHVRSLPTRIVRHRGKRHAGERRSRGRCARYAAALFNTFFGVAAAGGWSVGLT